MCKRWSILCLENPPPNQDLVIYVESTLSPTLIHWIAKLGHYLRAVVVTISDLDLPWTLLAQVLSVLALSLPRLRRLRITLPELCVDTYDRSDLRKQVASTTDRCVSIDMLVRGRLDSKRGVGREEIITIEIIPGPCP